MSSRPGPRARWRAWLAEHRFAHRVPLHLPRGLFSFSFDDVPVSAVECGAPLLEAAGARGTFYLAGELTLGGGEFLDLDGAARLATRGHHLGAHGTTHRSSAGRPARDVYSDALQSQMLLCEAVGEAIEDFAWPFGVVSLSAKRLLARQFASMRGTRRDLHAGSVDLACLRAVPLYGSEFDRGSIAALVERCAALRGWLVFYTHGVEPRPDAWGTAPDDLGWLIDACGEHGEIASVRDARRRVLEGLRGHIPAGPASDP